MTKDCLLALVSGEVSVRVCFLFLILSTTVFTSTGFNLSMAFVAPFFGGLSLSSLVRLVL